LTDSPRKVTKFFQISENLNSETFFPLKLVAFRIFLLPLPPDKIINVELNIYSNSTMTATEFSLST